MVKKHVIYTYGVFDMLHVGHLRALKQAKKLGSVLIVGVFTDEVAEGFKRKPVISQDQRIELIKALDIVDDTVLQHDFSPQENINLLRPDIVAKAQGAGWEDTAPEYDGCKSVMLKYTEGISTSDTLRRIRDSK